MLSMGESTRFYPIMRKLCNLFIWKCLVYFELFVLVAKSLVANLISRTYMKLLYFFFHHKVIRNKQGVRFPKSFTVLNFRDNRFAQLHFAHDKVLRTNI